MEDGHRIDDLEFPIALAQTLFINEVNEFIHGEDAGRNETRFLPFCQELSKEMGGPLPGKDNKA